jgi:Fic family protein
MLAQYNNILFVYHCSHLENEGLLDINNIIDTIYDNSSYTFSSIDRFIFKFNDLPLVQETPTRLNTKKTVNIYLALKESQKILEKNKRITLERHDYILGDFVRLSLDTILHLHRVLMKHNDGGLLRDTNIAPFKIDNSNFHYINYELIPLKLEHLIDKTNYTLETFKNSIKKEEYIHLAAYFLFEFLTIHPFHDGNGRLAHILVNWLLSNITSKPFIIKCSRKHYLTVLEECRRSGNCDHLILLIQNNLQ